ncbi:MAG: site-specific integrase [Acidithiobacillus sp.]|jgi:hypothetical protein|uniref:site-specific integrase n=1 Tax=Acidithiobacillus sp. TaxID=1872118 RepID=UPI00355D386E
MIDIDRLSSGFVTWMAGQNFQNPYSPATIRIYGHTVRRFLEYSGSDGVLDISEAGIHIVRKVVTNGIDGTISPKSTQTVRISAIVLFFDYLESEGAVLMNQARIVIFYKRTINYAFSIAKIFHAHSGIADGRHHVCFVGMRQERCSRQRRTKNHLGHQLHWITLFLRAQDR